ncbi:hypothetical protein V6N12_058254 [Hibiscus sabdariffa]|uniref:O-fucosyltransferase family protein n=1 Tax=Hibiscus sabdariffa TaxID=183260 RepID=A0ABR2ERM1_9ROSI
MLLTGSKEPKLESWVTDKVFDRWSMAADEKSISFDESSMTMEKDFKVKPTVVLDQIQDVTNETFCDMKICPQFSTMDEGHRTGQFKLLDNTIKDAVEQCGIKRRGTYMVMIYSDTSVLVEIDDLYRFRLLLMENEDMERTSKRKSIDMERQCSVLENKDCRQKPINVSGLPKFYVNVFKDLASTDSSVREAMVEMTVTELHEEYNRLKNEDLVVLELDEKSFWVGPSDFEGSFDIRHSIDSLRDGVHIIKRLPKRFSRKYVFEDFKMPLVRWPNEKYHMEQTLPLISKHKGLKFTSQIETLGHKLICILQENGPFVALHLRCEMDMLAFLGCTHGYTVEKECGRVKECTHSFMSNEDQFNDGDVAKKQWTAFQYIPLGRTILGLADNIKSITKRDLEKYIHKHYSTAPRMVIVVFGAVKHEKVVEQVKKLFTKLSSNAVTVYQLVVYRPTTFTSFEVRIINDDVSLALFAVAFEGAS